jgi:hypothetical protein
MMKNNIELSDDNLSFMYNKISILYQDRRAIKTVEQYVTLYACLCTIATNEKFKDMRSSYSWHNNIESSTMILPNNTGINRDKDGKMSFKDLYDKVYLDISNQTDQTSKNHINFLLNELLNLKPEEIFKLSESNNNVERMSMIPV